MDLKKAYTSSDLQQVEDISLFSRDISETLAISCHCVCGEKS